MKHVIIYDLKDKDNKNRTRILQKLYGYLDNSNYDYQYKRKGLLSGIKYKKEKKSILYLKTKKDLEKTKKILKELKIKFELISS